MHLTEVTLRSEAGFRNAYWVAEDETLFTS